jgi:glucokinase
MLLAGDMGGTKTLLGLFERSADPRPPEIVVREYSTLEFGAAAHIVTRFFEETGHRPDEIEAACFGVPGPVIDQVVELTNVDWDVDGRELQETVGLGHVWVLNDLEAMAYVVPTLRADELHVLQEGKKNPTGNGALMAAGTGLGQAMLIHVDGGWRPSPSEGGHADFAARTPREIELLAELTRIYGRAHYEHVICGPGLVNLARFTSKGQSFVFRETSDAAELPARIARAAIEGRCPHCKEALEMFVSAFGAAAGNFGMQCMATGGVFIGGGIPPKLLDVFKEPTFIEAFNAKEPLDDLVKGMPVSIILNRRAGLIGAAVYANRM